MSLLPAFLSIEENCINTVQALLDTLKSRVVRSSVSDKLKEHPDYPSLLSISDTLYSWKINNLSIRATAEQLPDMPVPFIAQLADGKGEVFTTVRSFGPEKVVISAMGSRKWKTVDLTTFLDQWTGVIMVVEEGEQAGEPAYALKKKQAMTGRAVTFLAVAMILLLWGNTVLSAFYESGTAAIIPGLLFTLQLFGSYITGLLLWYEIDKNNPSLKAICNGHRQTNCDAVLQSKAAKLWDGVVSWSEAGFFYFAGSFLAVLISGLHKELLQLQAWLSVLALPYVIFSVYYQWRIAKNWCVLCLAVQAVLFTAGLLMLSTTPLTLAGMGLSTCLLQAACFVAPAIVWLLLRPLLLQVKDAMLKKAELARVKHHPQVFESLLIKQKQISHDLTGLGILLGNPASRNRIVKVCSPYCQPCARSHAQLDELLTNNPDLQVQIIFTAANADSDRRAAPVKHLMALAAKNDEALTRKALHDWYTEGAKDYDAFSRRYVLNGEEERQGEKLEAMRNWCDRMEISFTPTLFLNGYQLPEMYSASELKYFLSR